MLKIGDFSKLSQLTVKTLRFYEKEGLLLPEEVASDTGYRYYASTQLLVAAHIKSLRQLGLSLDEVKRILKGENERDLLLNKARELEAEQESLAVRLSIIHHLLTAPGHAFLPFPAPAAAVSLPWPAGSSHRSP